MSRPLWKTFALVIAGIVLSVPLAAILETLASFSLTPGSLVIYYLGPEGGLKFLGTRLLVALSIDSALCFAAMFGLYKLAAARSRKRERI